MSGLRRILSFPNPVNEVAVRLVAGMVVILSIVTILVGHPLLFLVLAYGFLARVVAGPTFSPMGLLATRVIVPVPRQSQSSSPRSSKAFRTDYWDGPFSVSTDTASLRRIGGR